MGFEEQTWAYKVKVIPQLISRGSKQVTEYPVKIADIRIIK